jgi:hypothetical protein
MANCKICGYFYPDGAKKCAHCGEDFREKPKPSRWSNLLRVLHALSTPIVAIAIITQCIILLRQANFMETQTNLMETQTDFIETQTKILETRFITENMPSIKIGGISFMARQYTETSDDKSIFARFQIPIENNSGGTAYDVEILKKELDTNTPKGKIGLDHADTMQTPLTQRKFDLFAGQIKTDTIYIDFAPQYFEKYQSGENSFTLEYEIRYRALEAIQKEPFIYRYKITYTKDGFQYDQLYEHTTGK